MQRSSSGKKLDCSAYARTQARISGKYTNQANPKIKVYLWFIGRTLLAEVSVSYNGTGEAWQFPLTGSATFSIHHNTILLSGMLFG